MKEYKIPTQEVSEEVKLPVYGNEIYDAPQPALTTADSSSIDTASSPSRVVASAGPIIDNMRTRINEIEAALKNLGLLK